jgi:hypothetical protein
VSGALPETERERQVRELASRLLTHPDPDGPITVDLLPVGYPDDLPPDLVDRTDLRFLGSAVRRRAGELTGVELAFEGPGEPTLVLERYEAELLQIGWVRLEQMRPVRGGFESRGFGDMAVLVNESKTAMLTLHALDREAGGSDLRVRYDISRVREMLAMQQGTTRETSVLPVLRPPPGVRMRSEGHGGGGWRWSSAATAETDKAPMELEAYFAKQLEAAGWGRMDGSADESFAWSGWLVPNVPPAPEWRGVLLVLAAFPGWRQVSVSAELVQPGSRRGGGGYAVSRLIG